jgi:hypothetical protein
MNFILVSSDHSFPFDLEKLDFNTVDIHDLIYAGEVSPKETYKLLTQEWSMDNNLASAFVESFGGHIYNIYNAVDSLIDSKQKFSCIDREMIASVKSCLRAMSGDAEILNAAKRILQKLAIKGFTSFNLTDDFETKAAETISKYHVGGVVTSKGKKCNFTDIFLINGTEWERGLVPSSQAMRLAILKALK